MSKGPTDKKMSKMWGDRLLELNRLDRWVYTSAPPSERKKIIEFNVAANELEAKAFEAIKVNQNPNEYRRLMREAAMARDKGQKIKEQYLPAMREALERGEVI